MTTSSQLKGSQNYIWSKLDLLGEGATGAVFKGRHKVNELPKKLLLQKSNITSDWLLIKKPKLVFCKSIISVSL
jgi:hypothetical protein